MTVRKDLTRWNRAGLSKFRYVDGNAITYLEQLRERMIEAFTENDTLRWETLGDVADDEDRRKYLDRVLAQYRGDRQDYGWEIMRTLARSIHILTEHLDAYANESYLTTATQWDNVRKLVEMIDYHPAPPASASTVIALHAKENKQGTVETGFKIKNQPEDGSPPVIFETLSDLEVDWRLNAMRAADWNKSQDAFSFKASGKTYSTTLDLEKPLKGVSVGGIGILLFDFDSGTVGHPVQVSQISDTKLKLNSDESSLVTSKALKGQVRLLLDPKKIEAPKLFGGKIIELDQVSSVVAGNYVAWNDGSKWVPAKVVAVEESRLKLQVDGDLPPVGMNIHLLAESTNVDGDIIVPFERGGSKKVWGADFNELTTEPITIEFPDPIPDVNIRDEVQNTARQSAFYVFKDSSELGKAKRRPLSTLEFSGSPGKLESGDWIIVAPASESLDVSELSASTISQINEGDDQYSLTLDSSFPPGSVLYGEFSQEIRPLGYDSNKAEMVVSSNSATNQSTFLLDLAEVPELFIAGRQLIVRDETSAVATTLRSADLKNGGVVVTVQPSVDSSFLRNATIIHGNVVDVGHGETKPQKVLGSGDATQTGQEMLFEMEEVSFVADFSMPSGVRSAIVVIVDGRTWKQVPTLADSEPEDPNYVVRLTEDGYLLIRFGDGYLGRRLPSGRSNVRISYRLGAGLSGNLAAGSLRKAVKPHRLIESVEQPIASSGGNDLEGIESLRTNAPSSVLALERAVSLRDFATLAASYSGVWQANAYPLRTQFAVHESVRVAAVPAGGGKLGTTANNLKKFLVAHAMPGVKVEVVDFRPVLLGLEIILRVKLDEFDSDLVAFNVREAVLREFCLEKRVLGAPLFRSRVFQVVEAIRGVENCDCRLQLPAPGTVEDLLISKGPDGVIRSARVASDQVIYMDANKSNLKIETKSFTL